MERAVGARPFDPDKKEVMTFESSYERLSAKRQVFVAFAREDSCVP
jgi:hypothetical protein